MGVSFSTVSKALNDDPTIKQETKNRVRDVAAEMGYLPNLSARTLRSRKSNTVGIIMNVIENPSIVYMTKQVILSMADNGFSTLVCDSNYSLELERNNILSILSRSPDYVIINPISNNVENLYAFKGMYDRLIIWGAENKEIDCHYITVDYKLGGYLSAQKMLAYNHRDILIITEPLEYPISGQYLEGIKEAYRDYDVPFNEEMVLFSYASIDGGYNAIADIWDSRKVRFKKQFTGVLTFSDMLAHGVYKALGEFDFSIPDDFSIIGFDDNPLSAFSMPPLTTVYLPKEKIAESMIRIIRNDIENGPSEKAHVMIEPHLVSRKSVKRLR